MVRRLDKDIINILKSNETKVFHLMKIPNIPDEQYDRLVVAIGSIGGTWSEKHQGFMFNHNPKSDIDKLIKSGEFDLSEEKIWKEKVQFYPTPSKIVDIMIKMANLKKNDIVLEPSAGRGAILDRLPDYVKTVAVEFDESNVKTLHEKGHNVFWADFLEMNNIECNKVIMNPPFSKYQDVKHILHAYNLLKKGGTLVAIMNGNTIERRNTNETCKNFFETIKDTNYEIINLPEGSFAESDTMINTAIIKIQK